jgi:acetylornithine deacetylase/succinyl-diaminopimelate desuccinylase-like protein
MVAHASKQDLETWYDANETRILEEFFTFLRFQSISTDPSYSEHVLACADWLESYLKTMGFTIERWPTSGYPTLFAEWTGAGPDKESLLIYNHYDVQPIDPEELWDSPAFEPEIRDGEIFARGAQDNKGQCFYTLQALRALWERDGAFPVNIKLVIEGEEECGSAGFAAIVEERKAQLEARNLLIVDVGIHKPDAPSVTLGVRGMTSLSVEIEGSNTDLHSGSHGGIAYNPNHALVSMLAQLRGPDGRILVPGFYDGVAEPSPEDLAAYQYDITEEEYRSLFDAEPCGGESKYSFHESGALRPTLELNGLAGGYAGPGFKTVIPAKAQAKVSCRLVPGQDPDDIADKIQAFLQELCPSCMRLKVERHAGGGRAVRGNPESRLCQAFVDALTDVFGKPCAKVLEGASIPVVAHLAGVIGAETLLIGLGLPSDNIHAPNEHFGVDRLRRGCLMLARGLEILGSR